MAAGLLVDSPVVVAIVQLLLAAPIPTVAVRVGEVLVMLVVMDSIQVMVGQVVHIIVVAGRA